MKSGACGPIESVYCLDPDRNLIRDQPLLLSSWYLAVCVIAPWRALAQQRDHGEHHAGEEQQIAQGQRAKGSCRKPWASRVDSAG